MKTSPHRLHRHHTLKNALQAIVHLRGARRIERRARRQRGIVANYGKEHMSYSGGYSRNFTAIALAIAMAIVDA